MLSDATFDLLVKLQGLGPTRAQQCLQLREEAGGKVTGSWLRNIGRARPIQECLFSMVRV